jgi:uncharacterized membrane protein YgcG
MVEAPDPKFLAALFSEANGARAKETFLELSGPQMVKVLKEVGEAECNDLIASFTTQQLRSILNCTAKLPFLRHHIPSANKAAVESKLQAKEQAAMNPTAAGGGGSGGGGSSGIGGAFRDFFGTILSF